MKGKLWVKFKGDLKTDNVGATLKEYFSLFSNDLLHPDYKLFYNNDGRAQNNRITFDDVVSTNRFPGDDDLTDAKFDHVIVHMDYINRLRHVGNVIGMAILNKQIMDITFDKPLYKMIIDSEIHDFIISVKGPTDDPILADDKTTDKLTGSTELPISDNKPTSRPFKLDYSPQVATPETNYSDRKRFTLTFSDKKIYEDAYLMISKFNNNQAFFAMTVVCQGIFQIIPQDAFTEFKFNEDEIKRLISGNAQALNMWKWEQLGLPTFTNNENSVITWFRHIMKNSEPNYPRILSFITGISRVPIGLLDGDHDKSKPYIKIVVDEKGTVPRSDPYTNTLYLPLQVTRGTLVRDFNSIVQEMCGAPNWFVSAAKLRWDDHTEL